VLVGDANERLGQAPACLVEGREHLLFQPGVTRRGFLLRMGQGMEYRGTELFGRVDPVDGLNSISSWHIRRSRARSSLWASRASEA